MGLKIMKERIVYVNGEFLNESEAKVSVFDRGFLFADAVYEVTAIIDSKILEWDGHIKRLQRSLNELGMNLPIKASELLDIHYNLISKNNLTEGLIYLQITRGEDDRSFDYPDEGVKQTIVLFTQVNSESEEITNIKHGDVILRDRINSDRKMSPGRCEVRTDDQT